VNKTHSSSLETQKWRQLQPLTVALFFHSFHSPPTSRQNRREPSRDPLTSPLSGSIHRHVMASMCPVRSFGSIHLRLFFLVGTAFQMRIELSRDPVTSAPVRGLPNEGIIVKDRARSVRRRGKYKLVSAKECVGTNIIVMHVGKASCFNSGVCAFKSTCGTQRGHPITSAHVHVAHCMESYPNLNAVLPVVENRGSHYVAWTSECGRPPPDAAYRGHFFVVWTGIERSGRSSRL